VTTELDPAIAAAVTAAIQALALAHTLGAPKGPLEELVSRFSFLATGVHQAQKPQRRKRRKPRKILEEDVRSAWDPADHDEQLEVSRCRALLLEVVRRAAHDWILYRTSQRLHMKQVAEDAYIWLFEEGPGHSWWTMRKNCGSFITAFINICELLDLDPTFVRTQIRKLTVKQIMAAGRPAERRRQPTEVSYMEHEVMSSVDLVSIDEDPNCVSQYEAHYAVPTLVNT